MTIGEKIKFCRKRAHLTQTQLADLSGVHPVSVRKYETDKMVPHPEHLIRIANALGVSYNALNGIENSKLRFETVGDLMGIILLLCNSNILIVSGEYDDDDRLISDTISFKFNPVLSYHLGLNLFQKDATEQLPLSDILISIKDNDLLENFINWEHLSRLAVKYQNAAKTNPSEDNLAMADAATDAKEKMEIILQSSKCILNTEKSSGSAITNLTEEPPVPRRT